MYDEKAEPALQAVVRAVSLVNFSPRLRNTRDANGTADRGRPVTVEMHELTRELRARILAPDAVFDNADLSSRAKAIRDSLVDFLAYERQVFIGNATQMNYAPIIWTRSVTPPDGHTPSNARGAPDDGQPGSGE
ncbi:hypothetical protein BN159_0321 [Streptomyces davaonensis JCM 4913]|uniref:Uncharacterized protein n=2 Tax=Streptomyces davaonensis TaxID=348043 RepID=K4QV50_STRDJ|nr:hypothetical protein BN159_0321 [Streptomyces davaonensis JCM 4913]